MPRVIHFEIHGQDPEQLIKFYADVFGWKFTRWEGPMDYWLIQTGEAPQPGIDGGLVRRMGSNAGEAVLAYVCTIDVPNVDDYLEKVTRAGGTIALPKMEIPSVGWLAYAKDPDGNIFGMMESLSP